MGIWFYVAITMFVGAMGASVSSLTLGAPTPQDIAKKARRIQKVSGNAVVEKRRAFEYMASIYVAKYPAYSGKLTLAVLKADGIISSSLGQASYPPTWSVTVVAGGGAASQVPCTPGATPLENAALSKAGFAAATIACTP